MDRGATAGVGRCWVRGGWWGLSICIACAPPSVQPVTRGAWHKLGTIAANKHRNTPMGRTANVATQNCLVSSKLCSIFLFETLFFFLLKLSG